MAGILGIQQQSFPVDKYGNLTLVLFKKEYYMIDVC